MQKAYLSRRAGFAQESGALIRSAAAIAQRLRSLHPHDRLATRCAIEACYWIGVVVANAGQRDEALQYFADGKTLATHYAALEPLSPFVADDVALFDCAIDTILRGDDPETLGWP